MKQTPTQWRTLDMRGKSRRIAIVSENGHTVASMPAIDYEQQRADANHIVRCVNSHDELVKALAQIDANCAESPEWIRRVARAAISAL